METQTLAYLLFGVALVVLFGFFPALRTMPGAKSALAMPIVIEVIMLAVAAVLLMANGAAGNKPLPAGADNRFLPDDIGYVQLIESVVTPNDKRSVGL